MEEGGPCRLQAGELWADKCRDRASWLESCGQTSAGTGPPPAAAPFSPARTRQPGNQEQGGRQIVGQGAPQRDGSEGALERFLALVPVSPGLLWGSHPSLPHGPPAEESGSRVNWGSNPMLPGSAWPQPFPVRKPLVPAPGSKSSLGLTGLPSQGWLSQSSRVLTLSVPSAF